MSLQHRIEGCIPEARGAEEVWEAHLHQVELSQNTPAPMWGTRVCPTCHPEHRNQTHVGGVDELTLITVLTMFTHGNCGDPHRYFQVRTASHDVQNLLLEHDQIRRFQSVNWPETWTWRASRCIPTASWPCPRRPEWPVGGSYSPDWETACKTPPPSEAAPTGTLW